MSGAGQVRIFSSKRKACGFVSYAFLLTGSDGSKALVALQSIPEEGKVRPSLHRPCAACDYHIAFTHARPVIYLLIDKAIAAPLHIEWHLCFSLACVLLTPSQSHTWASQVVPTTSLTPPPVNEHAPPPLLSTPQTSFLPASTPVPHTMRRPSTVKPGKETNKNRRCCSLNR